MSKAAKQWRGAVIRLFTDLEDLWAGVGGSCGRGLARDPGGAVHWLQNHKNPQASEPWESCRDVAALEREAKASCPGALLAPRSEVWEEASEKGC